jgi:hypothetical protein
MKSSIPIPNAIRHFSVINRSAHLFFRMRDSHRDLRQSVVNILAFRANLTRVQGRDFQAFSSFLSALQPDLIWAPRKESAGVESEFERHSPVHNGFNIRVNSCHSWAKVLCRKRPTN